MLFCEVYATFALLEELEVDPALEDLLESGLITFLTLLIVPPNNSEIPLPNINIDLSKNLNDLSNYYRDIYTKTKLELDIEKEKSNSLEQNKIRTKTKIKNLIKDKNILLENIKNS